MKEIWKFKISPKAKTARIGHFKSNKQFYTLDLLKNSVNCFHIFCRFRNCNKLFFILILGKSRFPPKKFYNIKRPGWHDSFSTFVWAKNLIKFLAQIWAVVVAQLVERPLPTPEVLGSNPVIGEFIIEHFLTYCQLYWKYENKEKEAWNGQF